PHFGLDVGKFLFKLLDLRLLFDAIFAEKVDWCDATGLGEGGIYEISIEYTYLRKSFRRESCPFHPLRFVEFQFDITLIERLFPFNVGEQPRQRRFPTAVPAIDQIEPCKRMQVLRPGKITKNSQLQLGDTSQLHPRPLVLRIRETPLLPVQRSTPPHRRRDLAGKANG